MTSAGQSMSEMPPVARAFGLQRKVLSVLPSLSLAQVMDERAK